MNTIRCACWVLVLGSMAPAWAINKCTDAGGKISFQDAPCTGPGEKIEVRPSMQGATPVPTPSNATSEGAFGPTWRRKNQLQNQAIPQARAAVDRNQRECAALGDLAAQTAPLRRGSVASGHQLAQERAEKVAEGKAACDARTQALRDQLQTLEKELAALSP